MRKHSRNIVSAFRNEKTGTDALLSCEIRVAVEGCKITRQSRREKTPPTTYAQDAAAILHQRCAGCHRPNTAVPFSLLTYQDDKQQAEMIYEVVADRSMPPWDADARFGKFEEPIVMPEGTGICIPKGYELLFQLRYTPNGKEAIDRSDENRSLGGPNLGRNDDWVLH